TAAGNRLVEQGIPYEVVPNFVDDEADGNGPDAGPFLDTLPDGDFMLFVGEVEPYKGVNTLLQAYSQESVHALVRLDFADKQHEVAVWQRVEKRTRVRAVAVGLVVDEVGDDLVRDALLDEPVAGRR